MRHAFLVTTLLLVGCGFGVPSQASCDFRPKAAECTDLLTNRNNQVEATLRTLCLGAYSNGLCDRTGSLGGCECDGCENGKSVTWKYPDPANNINTAADVMKSCGTQPYVAP